MSIQGSIETDCPKCGDGFDAPVWSFVHGGKDEALRDQALAAECNMLLCPSCGAAFLPEASWVYFEPEAEILAFVFPESYAAEEGKWRAKMKEDFAQMRGALEGGLPLDHEPELFFGPNGLAELLEAENWRRDERDVMEHFAREAGLSLFRASPAWSRANGAPCLLPYAGRSFDRASLISGLKTIVAANDRLTAWSTYLAELEKNPKAPLPPAAKAGA